MAKTDPAVELLRSVPLFADLTKSELAHVAGIARPVDFPARTAVVTEGSNTERFYVIVDGEVEVQVQGHLVKRLTNGDFFGEMALLDAEPRMATVVTTTPLRALSIASFNFRALLQSEPAITYKILTCVSQRLRALQQSVL